MAELRLKYTDEYGETKRVSVRDEIFTIGRHSENDLCIPDQRLSREHIRIELFGDTFYVSDSNSSNGTTINGAKLTEAVIIRNGDRLNLGGGVEIQAEIGSEEANANKPAANENPYPAVNEEAISPSVQSAKTVSANVATASSDSNSIPTLFFWLAPVFGLIVLVFVGGLFLAFSGKKQKEIVSIEEIPSYSPRNSSRKDETPISDTPKTSDSPKSGETPTPTPNSNTFAATPKTSGDVEKIEQNAASFLRKIAKNDSTAFLTGKQAEIVNSKIGQFKNSSALAENIKAVKKNAAQFESLANSKNLKAQFLATAALARIGNNRGDPLSVANTMLPILSDLKVTLDNKLADDNLLIIAAYERGAAGKPRSLQSTLEAISKNAQNISPREIRTIWFLREKDKISEAEFNFALQFIAIGVITQNPKDFNVSADALTFN
jgi:pSer/pThr/pTyr-binding forkhead associated (FHA) protein